MAEHAFSLLNVFTVGDDRFSGNPLCVFEDARGLSDVQMQSLAKQFNLSETTFVLPAEAVSATARVRIFTPTFEMPFAGHPTLGTAHVVRRLRGAGDALSLEMKAGRVEVSARGDAWTLRAAQAPVTRAPSARPEELAAMLRLSADAMRGPALWVDTGVEQLVVPLRTADDVRRATPDAALLAQTGHSPRTGESMAYVWAPTAGGEVLARFFFLVNGGLVEDPATGSACANLGGWSLATEEKLPVRWTVRQGESIGRPSRLGLHVDEAKQIYVTGSVIELGRGVVRI